MTLDKAKAKRAPGEQAGQSAAAPASHGAAQPVEQPQHGAAHRPKFMTYEVKLSILLTGGQLEYVERLVHEIMRSRSVKTERITKNTIFRCLVDVLATTSFDTRDIPDEEELRRRLRAALGR